MSVLGAFVVCVFPLFHWVQSLKYVSGNCKEFLKKFLEHNFKDYKFHNYKELLVRRFWKLLKKTSLLRNFFFLIFFSHFTKKLVSRTYPSRVSFIERHVKKCFLRQQLLKHSCKETESFPSKNESLPLVTLQINLLFREVYEFFNVQ